MYVVVDDAKLRLARQIFGRMYVCTDAAAVKVGDQQLLHVTPEHEVEEGAAFSACFAPIL